MKTSNKIMVAALALVLGSVASYDMALRAEYRTGSYKDPLRNYTKQASRAAFDAVEVPSGFYSRVEIEAGPAGVWVNKEATDNVRLSQHGRTLTVTFLNPDELHFLEGRPHVIIRCPQLLEISAVAPSPARQRQAQDRRVSAEVLVRNFRQDSLRVAQQWASNVTLAGNTLNWLRAEAGTRPGSEPELEIEASNRIQSADLTIGHRGHLTLATAIPRLRYQFSDNSSVVLTGAAARSLSASK